MLPRHAASSRAKTRTMTVRGRSHSVLACRNCKYVGTTTVLTLRLVNVAVVVIQVLPPKVVDVICLVEVLVWTIVTVVLETENSVVTEILTNVVVT